MSETAEKLRQLSVWLLSNDIDMQMPEGMIDPEVGADEIESLTRKEEQQKFIDIAAEISRDGE